ncbi:MAG: HAMP domain-containing protein [Lachnospiraceae bacterium]|nr:HAMP domain-containing protein [Lachnospiraceae bacterium]
MKYSIKAKFAVIFIAVMMLTFLACVVLNNLFLKQYYTIYKKSQLSEMYEIINNSWDDRIFDAATQEERDEAYESVLPILQQLRDEYGAEYLVMSSDWSDFCCSANNSASLMYRLRNNIFRKAKMEQYDLSKQLIIGEVSVASRTGTSSYLECWGTLEQGYPFLITIPMDSIYDSASIANRFLAYIGLISMFLGVIVMILTTNRMTRPIRELTNLSERIADLDFTAKYEGKSHDEIGVLGNNMNILSDKLEGTIKELKSANLELTRDIQKKEEIDDMRKDFISNVSHELKTPIALISGYAEGLRDGITDDPESMSFYCDVIIDEAAKMNRMVQKLMTLNQLEFGKTQTNIERFCLTELARNVVGSAELLAKNKNLQMYFDMPEDLYVFGDSFQIEEVLTNYVSNAINHCSGENLISVRAEILGNKVRVNVRNTGENIPEDSLDKVWEKFYKVDKARTREYGGSGIGLSIVKAIMEAHGQAFGVKNTDDGVCFWFELDRA